MDTEFFNPVIASKGSYTLCLVSANSRQSLLRLVHRKWDQVNMRTLRYGHGGQVTVEKWREGLVKEVAARIQLKGGRSWKEDWDEVNEEANRIMDSEKEELHKYRWLHCPLDQSDPNISLIESLRPVCRVAEDKAAALGQQYGVVDLQPSDASRWWHPRLYGALSVTVETQSRQSPASRWRRLSAVARCIVDTFHEMAPEGEPGPAAESRCIVDEKETEAKFAFDAEAARADMGRRFEEALLEVARNE